MTIKGWNGEGVGGTPAVDIPGWSSDEAAAARAWRPVAAPTDGLWTAFLRAGDSAVWQLTNHTIAAGEVFELKVDAMNGSPAKVADLKMTLCYDQAGVRAPAAVEVVPLTDGMQPYTLRLAVVRSPSPSAGRSASNSAI